MESTLRAIYILIIWVHFCEYSFFFSIHLNFIRIGRFAEKCSHVRAHHLFLESLNSKFSAIQCRSHEELKKNRCTFNGVVATMGGDITPSTPKAYGIYYLETNDKPPYNISDQQSFNRIQIIPYIFIANS